MKTKLIILAILILGGMVIKYQYDIITSLKHEVSEYKEQAEKEKQDALEKSKRIQELNKIIKESPESANYSAGHIDGNLLSQLRKQYLSKRD